MNRILTISRIAALGFGLLLTSLGPVTAAENISANDTARYLAGLKPAAGSPLTRLTRERGWINHARTLDQAWREIGNSLEAEVELYTEDEDLSAFLASFHAGELEAAVIVSAG